MPDLSRDAQKDLLRQHFLLEDLPERDLDELVKYARLVEVEAGETLFLKGDPGDSMMVIVEGRVLIFVTSADGREVIFNIMSPGEVFGEIALLDGRERTADARALNKTRYLALERRHFRPFLERNPGLCIEMMELLCSRIRYSSEQLEDATFLEIKPHLAKKLLAFGAHYGTPKGNHLVIDLPLTQTDLGSMLGTSRETVNRQLRAWVKEGVIAMEKNRITILDEDALLDASEETD